MPTCTINTASTTDGYDCTPSEQLTIDLIDKAVNYWSLTVYGTDDGITAEDIVISMNTSTKTALVTMPSAARGSAVILKSTTEAGSTTFGVFARVSNRARLLAAGQTIEGNSRYGWISDLNSLIENVAV